MTDLRGLKNPPLALLHDNIVEIGCAVHGSEAYFARTQTAVGNVQQFRAVEIAFNDGSGHRQLQGADHPHDRSPAIMESPCHRNVY